MLSAGSPPTRLFREYFTEGNVKILGTVKRRVHQKFREFKNTSMTKFLELEGIPVPQEYRMVNRNLAACYKDASKYDKSQPVVDAGSWALAGSWLKRTYHAALNGSRVMGHDEVVDAMDMSTSAGYPHNILYHNKKEMKDTTAWCILDDYWTNIGQGTVHHGRVHSPDRVMPIFCVAQKVELRAKSKIEANKIRTFTAAPVEHSYATNRMCLDFNIRFYDSSKRAEALGTSSFVGATKYLGGWDKLHARLSRRGTESEDEFRQNAFELDESQYDSSLFRAAMLGMVDLRWEFLQDADKTEDNYVRLHNIYEALVDTPMVLEDGLLIQKNTGNPSGSSNTIVDNTLILERLLFYAWIELCRKRGRDTTLEDFQKHVSAATNGDDNTYTCSDEVVDWFIPANIASVWSAVGVITKTPCETPRWLEDCMFLSSGFRKDPVTNMYLPCPEAGRLLSSLMWGSCVDDVRWHLLRASALRIDSFGNPELRAILSRYISFLTNNYSDEMVGVCENIPIKEILATWRDDKWIRALYAGHESAVFNSSLYERVVKVVSSREDLFWNGSKQTSLSILKSIQSKETYQSIMTRSKNAKKKKTTNKRVVMVAPSKKKKKHVPKHRTDVTHLSSRSQKTIVRTLTLPARETNMIDEIDNNADPYYMLAHVEINPGLQASFPWCSNVAQLFTEWRATNMSYEFVPVLGTEFTGEAMLSHTEDPYELFPSSLTQHSQDCNSKPAPIYKPSRVHVKPTPWLFVRSSNENRDRRVTDNGQVFFGITPVSNALGTVLAAGSTVGYLVVHYDIEVRYQVPTRANALSDQTDVIPTAGDQSVYTISSLRSGSHSTLAGQPTPIQFDTAPVPNQAHGFIRKSTATDTLGARAVSNTFLAPAAATEAADTAGSDGIIVPQDGQYKVRCEMDVCTDVASVTAFQSPNLSIWSAPPNNASAWLHNPNYELKAVDLGGAWEHRNDNGLSRGSVRNVIEKVVSFAKNEIIRFGLSAMNPSEGFNHVNAFGEFGSLASQALRAPRMILEYLGPRIATAAQAIEYIPPVLANGLPLQMMEKKHLKDGHFDSYLEHRDRFLHNSVAFVTDDDVSSEDSSLVDVEPKSKQTRSDYALKHLGLSIPNLGQR